MTDDARIGQEAPHRAAVEARHARGIEAAEGLPEVLALAQDGQPAQPGLESLEADLFEETTVVVDGKAPLLVVIADIERVRPRPPAPPRPVLTAKQPGRAHGRLPFVPCGCAASSR